jgi:hypothetical protein
MDDAGACRTEPAGFARHECIMHVKFRNREHSISLSYRNSFTTIPESQCRKQRASTSMVSTIPRNS